MYFPAQMLWAARDASNAANAFENALQHLLALAPSKVDVEVRLTDVCRAQ